MMKPFALFALLQLVIGNGVVVVAKEPTAADYQAFGEYLVGDWKWESEGPSGTMTITMSPTKRCLISLRSIGDRPVGHSIEGYDAENKTWKRVLFWEDGRHAIANVKILTAANGDSLDGLTLKGEVHDVDNDGFSQDSEVVYKIVDKNKWEVQREEGTTVYTRQTKE